MDYRDVNDNRTKFEDKTTANLELYATKQQLELLITIKNTSITRTRMDANRTKSTKTL